MNVTAANAARSFSVLTLIAFVVSAFTSCVDDRNVSLGTGGSAGKLGSAGDASASGGSAGATGSGGSAGGGGSENNDSSVTGGSGGAAGDDSGIQDSGAEAGVPLEQFCGLLLSEVCTWVKGCKLFARCEDWPMYPRIQTTCLAAPTAVAAGRLRYDPLEAKACLDAVSKPTVPDGGPCQRAGGPVVVTSLNFGQGPCARAFTGLVPPGGDCFTESSLGGSECAGGVCYRTAACPGRCVAYRRAAQSCGAPGEYCDPETFCNVNVCETRRAAGAQCDDDKQCQTGMICIPASDAGPLKRCVVLGGEGDACQVSASCGGRECHEGRCRAKVPTGAACRSDFVCPENEVCVMGSPLAKVGVCGSGLALGTACGKNTDCRGYQQIDPQGPTCKSTNGIEAPVCTAPAALNQPCGSRPCNPGPCDYLGCEAGTYCDSYSGGASICRSFSQSGGSCTTHAQCAAGLICMSGTTCRAPGALGENCSPENYAPSSCQDGLHCDWVTRKCALPRTGLAQGCTPRWSNSCQADMYCACEEPTCNSINWNTPSPTMCDSKRADGIQCQMPFQCIGGYCNSGKCARYPRFNYCDGIDDGPDAG